MTDDVDWTGQDVSTHYVGDMGARYARTVQRHRRLEGALNRDKFARYVGSSDRVLDFGCAGGDLLLALEPGERIGIEVNPITRSEAEQAGINVSASLATIADESIDVVVSNHVLEHVLSPHEALRGLRRVLRPHGRLVICVPADDWRNDSTWQPGDSNNHVFAWTPLTLGNLLVEAGFRPESVAMRHRAWPRYYVRLHSLLPSWAWEALCYVWAVIRRRREILAVAVPAKQGDSETSS